MRNNSRFMRYIAPLCMLSATSMVYMDSIKKKSLLARSACVSPIAVNSMPPEHLRLKKINEQQQEEIKSAIERLPLAKQPQNIDQAMEYMHCGITAWNEVAREQSLATIIGNIADHDQRDEIESISDEPEFLSDLQKDQTLLDAFLAAYQLTIIQIIWAFYSETIINSNQAFDGGMITFYDPHSDLFNFLDGYAELINKGYKTQHFLRSLFPWTKPAYNRGSSHWKGQRCMNGKNFGIDLTVKKGDLLLPGNRSHILFGERTNGMTFVKCEEHGTRIFLGGLRHAWSYLTTRNDHDECKHSKENIPFDILKKFKELSCGSTNLPPKNIINQNAEIHGIAYMLETLRQCGDEYAEAFKAYVSKHRDYMYNADWLHLRRGGEAIIGC